MFNLAISVEETPASVNVFVTADGEVSEGVLIALRDCWDDKIMLPLASKVYGMDYEKYANNWNEE